MRAIMSMLGLASALLVSSLGGALAQSAQSGIVDPIRDCQTIRQCRFTKGGSYRGCISTYTCRVCKLVTTRCEIGGVTQNCREMRCGWGGAV